FRGNEENVPMERGHRASPERPIHSREFQGPLYLMVTQADGLQTVPGRLLVQFLERLHLPFLSLLLANKRFASHDIDVVRRGYFVPAPTDLEIRAGIDPLAKLLRGEAEFTRGRDAITGVAL